NEPPLDHGERCFQRHLEAFADDVKLSQIGDSWNWLARFTPKSRYLTATAFLPPEPVTLNEWLRMALKTAHGETAVCCAAAARIARASLVRRSA
ncbi:MAG TPA: hypothetical protein VL475_13565, partial [Planctomycetaceae bacterium]|nr:hypothetical protein [Planctomycetaceae bacterium]